MPDIPKLASVAVAAPRVIDVTWGDGRVDRIDLGDWIAAGGVVLAPLVDPAVFATARVDAHRSGIAWGDDDDLAIDAHHLLRIAEDAADVAAYDAAKRRLARGEDELVPADVANEIRDRDDADA